MTTTSPSSLHHHHHHHHPSPSSASSSSTNLILPNFPLNVTNCNQSQPPHFSSLIGKSLQLQDQGKYGNVTVEEVIAEGGFGVIFLVKHSHEHSKGKYALKRVVVNNERDYWGVTREVAIMSTLSSKTPHILASLTHVVHQYAQQTYEVQNLMPLCKQNLHQLASSRMSKQSSFAEHELLEILTQVSTALQYLHSSSPPIVHRDIKIENILCLDESYVLSDFGSATTVQWDPAVDNITAINEDLDKHTTLQYRSPEMVDLYGERGPLGPASDIWALGVCAYKLMCYKDPFESILAIQNRNLVWSIKFGKYSPEFVQFVECLLAEYQSVRPGVEEVIGTSAAGLAAASGSGSSTDWISLVNDRVAKIDKDLKAREELQNAKTSVSKEQQQRNVVLETTVTPRQRPKRGQVPAGGAVAAVPIVAAVSGGNGGVAAGSVVTAAAGALPPPPPKSPKPVSPGDNNSSSNTASSGVAAAARFFSPSAPPLHQHQLQSSQNQTISLTPSPNVVTPSPSPQPHQAAPPPTSSWNPFDEDYQQPPQQQHHHHQNQQQPNNKLCDNDSIQKNEEDNDEDEEEDDPFANAPFDYFKYQPIMISNSGGGGGGGSSSIQNPGITEMMTNHVNNQQYQPYYAPNNPFLYDVHSSNNCEIDNNVIGGGSLAAQQQLGFSGVVTAGVCNLSFEEPQQLFRGGSSSSCNNNNSNNNISGGGEL